MPILIEEVRLAFASARFPDEYHREFQIRPSFRKSRFAHSRSIHYNLSSSQLLPIPHDSRRTITLIFPSLAPQQPVPVVRVSVTGRLELAQDAFDLVELFRGEVDVDGLDVLDGTFGRSGTGNGDDLRDRTVG